MRSTISWTITIVTTAAALSTGVLLVSGLKPGFDLQASIQLAHQEGLPLALPKVTNDANFNRLVALVRQDENYVQELRRADTVDDYRYWAAVARRPHAAVHKISERAPNGNRWQKDDHWTLVPGSYYCVLSGVLAILENDWVRLASELEAIRGLANIAPVLDREAAIVHSHLVERYCELMQFAADSSTSVAQIEILEDLARKWASPDYSGAARYLAADQLETEDTNAMGERDASYGHGHLFEESLNRSGPETRRRKAKAIESGVQVVRRWQDAHAMLAMQSSDEPVASGAGSLKCQELNGITYLRALLATLRANRSRVAGEPWPTIDQLGIQGMDVVHPLNREPFKWLLVKGKRRIGSLANCNEGLPCDVVIRNQFLGTIEWAHNAVKKEARN